MALRAKSTVDPMMRVKVWFCSECEQPAPTEKWQLAWNDEYRRRDRDPEFDAEDHGAELGLDDRMVCPRCAYVHSDDECSFVDELDALVVVIQEHEVAG